MNKVRKQVLDGILENCLKDKQISNKLIYVALIGSTRTNEEIEGYSDLDVLLILNSNKSGAIKNEVITKLKKVSEKISSQSSIEISLLPHTVFDFEQYVDFNYLIHYSWGKVLYGSENKFKELFKDIINKKYSEKIRKDLIYYNLIHARFNLIRKYISWNKYNRLNYKIDILKLIIDIIVEICDWALVYKNIFGESKIDVVENFDKTFILKKYNHIPKQAYEIRLNWNSCKYEEVELNNFIDESIMFTQEIIDLIYKEHVKN